jgi:hypothetical protein
LSLAVETTDIDEDLDTNNVADARIVVGVSHTYAF